MNIKALVVDPDRTARAVVKRLLSHVNVDVIEAENGLDALHALETMDPDFVVIEIALPILSGPDCLAAIRQSPVRPNIPVICITAAGTRENVHRMVALGVADFLLKPINPVEVLPRIKNLLVRVAQWRQRTSTRAIDSLLVVDHDPNFLAFARPLLEASFEVREAAASTAAAIAFRDATPKPTVVCLAEGLPVMNEDLLIDMIRRIAIEMGSTPPQFYLLSTTGHVPEEKALRYAGVLKKSFVPQAFVDEFRRVVLREQGPAERLRQLVRDGMHGEVVTAARQTVGSMIGGEIAELPADDPTPCPRGVRARILLTDPATGAALSIIVASGRQEVEALGSKVAGREITLEDGARDVMGEIANTIGGRLRANLLSRGFDLQPGPPEPGEETAEASGERPAELEARLRCADGEVFRVALEVEQGIAPPSSSLSPGGGGESDDTAGADTGATESAEPSVDDVLF